jgi:ADP-ribosyl-[dinitrogen reductase] hydrolase
MLNILLKYDKDKILGIILGHALGDALGAPVEFYPYSYYTGILNNPIIRYSRNYGKQISEIGQVTDDTEMALILLKTLENGYTVKKAVENYMIWANNKFVNCKGNVPFMGKNTRKLFIAPKPKYNLYLNRFNKIYIDEYTKENAQSNGCLMRAYPLAFYDDIDIIKQDVYITNPSKLSYNAVFVYVMAIKLALNGSSKKEIKEKIKNLIEEKELLNIFNKALNNEYINVTKNRGHIINSFYCAFLGLFQFTNYKEAIDKIICLGPEKDIPAKIFYSGKYKKSEILVGDTDTNAAITGALLGAYYGLKTLENNEIIKKNIEIMLNCDSTKGDIIRPIEYTLKQDLILNLLSKN